MKNSIKIENVIKAFEEFKETFLVNKFFEGYYT